METPILLEERSLCRGRRIEVIQRIYRYGDKEFVRDVVRFGRSVAIVPLKNDNTVILIKQFRAPLNKWILEIPAGRVEPGEKPEDAVRRELIEEIGYEPLEIKKIISIYMSPGYSDEILDIYIAKNLVEMERKPEVGELIEVIEIALNKAIEHIVGQGESDSKTLLALLLAKNYIEKEKLGSSNNTPNRDKP